MEANFEHNVHCLYSQRHQVLKAISLYVSNTLLTVAEFFQIIFSSKIISPTTGPLYRGVNIKGVTLLAVTAEGCPAENERFL